MNIASFEVRPTVDLSTSPLSLPSSVTAYLLGLARVCMMSIASASSTVPSQLVSPHVIISLPEPPSVVVTTGCVTVVDVVVTVSRKTTVVVVVVVVGFAVVVVVVVDVVVLGISVVGVTECPGAPVSRLLLAPDA